MKFLSKEHRTERDGRVKDRLKAVLLSDGGWTHCQIAEALFLDEETVKRHVAEHQDATR